MFARACGTASLLGALLSGHVVCRAQRVSFTAGNTVAAQHASAPVDSEPVYNAPVYSASAAVYSAALPNLPAPAVPVVTRMISESTSSSADPAEEAIPSDAAEGVIQPPAARVQPVHDPRLREGYRMRPFRTIAFGLTASTLGGGAEVATPLSRTLNLRVGASYVRYDVPFSTSGFKYDPGVKFSAMRSTIDWFPRQGGFHVSAGALYFNNTIAGSATVPQGQTFTLGDTTYTNSVDDPVHGRAELVYHRKTAPLVLLGFGNVLPRSGRHLSVPLEFGGAYLKKPDMNVDLAGTACTSQGCFNAATDPTVQSNLTQELAQYRGYLHYFQVYPVMSMGLACRF